jgi:long-chain fatty acid transport protein
MGAELKRGACPAAALALCGLLAAGAPAAGSGFAFNEQASKANALGGAFVAQADDPSAVFYNPGALALLADEPVFTGGLSTHNLDEMLYQGLPPGVGAETNGEQESAMNLVPHLYFVQALGEKMTAGIGIYQPFLLDAEWSQPDAFSGRFISLASEITAWDVAPTLGFQVSPGVGIGIGVIYRAAELGQLRREQTVNPNNGQTVDFASRAIDTSFEDGFGWSFGLQNRAGGFSWGINEPLAPLFPPLRPTRVF